MVGVGCPRASQLIVNEPFNKTAASEGSNCQYGGTTKKYKHHSLFNLDLSSCKSNSVPLIASSAEEFALPAVLVTTHV